jgi:hypothetical protein
MRCIQDTTSRTRGFTALQWEGIAPDRAFDGLGPVVGRRLHIAAGQRRSCCGAAIDLVAVEPGDPGLPVPARSAVRRVRPGHAIASATLAELGGGWIAVPGVNIRIGATGDLGGAVIAIAFADALAILRADEGQRLLVRTIVLIGQRFGTAPAGWQPIVAGAPEIPLAIGTDHLPDCAA